MIVCLIAGLLFNYTKLHQNVQKYMQDECEIYSQYFSNLQTGTMIRRK